MSETIKLQESWNSFHQMARFWFSSTCNCWTVPSIWQTGRKCQRYPQKWSSILSVIWQITVDFLKPLFDFLWWECESVASEIFLAFWLEYITHLFLSSTGAVARALAKKCGAKLKEECIQKGNFSYLLFAPVILLPDRMSMMMVMMTIVVNVL